MDDVWRIMREEADLQYVWDITRRSVEQFDKNISDIRKMCLTVTGVAVSASAYIVTRSDTTNVASTLMWLGSFIVGMAAVFWILDDHYHTYLKITAGICTKLEEEIGLPQSGVGVSSALGNYREAMGKKHRVLSRFVTDIVYISIGVAAIGALFIINLKTERLFEWQYLAWMLIDTASFIIVAAALYRFKPLTWIKKSLKRVVKGFTSTSSRYP